MARTAFNRCGLRQVRSRWRCRGFREEHGSAIVNTIQQLSGAAGIAITFSIMGATSAGYVQGGEAVDAAIEAQPGAADKVRAGKVQAVGALVGAVMKATRGQADASVVRRLLLERLGVSE